MSLLERRLRPVGRRFEPCWAHLEEPSPPDHWRARSAIGGRPSYAVLGDGLRLRALHEGQIALSPVLSSPYHHGLQALALDELPLPSRSSQSPELITGVYRQWLTLARGNASKGRLPVAPPGVPASTTPPPPNSLANKTQSFAPERASHCAHDSAR